METINAEVEMYKARYAGMTEYERAREESRLYNENKRPGWMNEHGARGKLDWLRAHGIKSGVGPRSNILRLGSWGEPLWAKVEAHEMPLAAAAAMAVTVIARVARFNEDTRLALQDELRKWEALPHTSVVNGVVSKRHGPRAKGTAAKKREPVPELRTENARVFWQSLRAALTARLLEDAPDIPASNAQTLTAAFTRELDGLIHTYRKRLGEEVIHHASKIGIPDLLAACELLNHEEPPEGDLREWLAIAKRRYRQLLRMYHPDMNGGDESQRGRYDAVIAAYNLCERWVEQHARKSPSLTVLPGGQKRVGR